MDGLSSCLLTLCFPLLRPNPLNPKMTYKNVNATLLIERCLGAEHATACVHVSAVFLWHLHFILTFLLILNPKSDLDVGKLYTLFAPTRPFSLSYICMCVSFYFSSLVFNVFVYFVCVGACMCPCVTVRVFWVMGFVHPLLVTAWMYPWQRQVDPGCKRSWWEGLESER